MKKVLLYWSILLMFSIGVGDIMKEPSNEKMLNDIDIEVEKYPDIDAIYINTFDGLHIMSIDDAKDYINNHPYDDITVGYRHCGFIK